MTKALRALVRRTAKLEQKRPSELLRQAAVEEAKQVIREHECARLKRLLAELPTELAGLSRRWRRRSLA